jgi:hypothetical protein
MQRWPVKTRAQAYKDGDGHYFTGKACKYLHFDQRSVASGQCVACNRMHAGKYRNTPKRGSVAFEVHCHPDDVETVKQFIAGIGATRDAAEQARLSAGTVDDARRALFPALSNAPADYQPATPTLRDKP